MIRPARRQSVRACLRVVLAVTAVSAAHASRGPSSNQPASLVRLRGHSVELHLAAATNHQAGPLLVYTTGDGGYPGVPPIFDLMRAWGYPMAAVSAPDWIETFTSAPDRTIEPSALAADYLAVIDGATGALKLSRPTPAVLVGFSRGAAFIVAAATDARLRDRVSGLLAIALPGRDEYVGESSLKADAPDATFKTYESLPRIGALRVAVIQSTRDALVPAAAAQARFGPDSPTRRFYSIDATDHDFGGKQAELIATMRMSLDWIVGGR